MKRKLALVLVLFVVFVVGYKSGKKEKPEATPAPQVKEEKPIEARKFPPEFWADQFGSRTNDWNTYISKDNTIAFEYPKNLVVYQRLGEGNIYLFPKERVLKGDFDLTRGFVFAFYKYGDYEYMTEDNAKVTGYDTDEFRFEDNFHWVSGVTFFDPKTESFIVKAETPEIGYKYIYSVYRNNAEKELGKLIFGTIVKDDRFELSKYRKLSTDNRDSLNPVQPGNVRSDKLGFRLSIPTGYTYSEVLNQDDKSYSLTVDNKNCGLNISDNPEYVGFSTSGALCANAGANSCLFYGKYFIPAIGGNMTIVKDVWDGKVRGYRGVAYGDNSGELSASISTTEPGCIGDLLNTLYSISGR